MFDIGWSEMLVIGAIALIVIGPKDLPKMIKQVTSWVRYLRGMVREFQSGVDDMVRDSDLDEARKALDFAKDLNPQNQLKKLIDPDDRLERDLDLGGQIRGDYDEEALPGDGASDNGASDNGISANGAFNDGLFDGDPAAKPKTASASSALNSGPAPEKSEPEKSAPKKPAPKKPAAKKTGPKKTVIKKAVPKKAGAKKPTANKAKP